MLQVTRLRISGLYDDGRLSLRESATSDAHFRGAKGDHALLLTLEYGVITMFYRILICGLIIGGFGLPVIAQDSEPKKVAASEVNPPDVQINLNAKDLETELKKAELVVQLRQVEVDATRDRDRQERRQIESQLGNLQVKYDAVQERLKVAENQLKSSTMDSDPPYNGKDQEIVQSKVNSLRSKIQEFKAEAEQAKLEIFEKQRRLALEANSGAYEKAKLLKELAVVQRDAVTKAIAARAESEQPKSQPDLLADFGLTKQDLADCKMHVIGLYGPSNDRTSDEVFVEVEKLDEPSVIVVSAYDETLWRLRLPENTKVKLVIVTGYFQQVIDIVGTSQTPMLKLTYFDNRNPVRDRPWAYAYSWRTSEGRKLANMLYDVTGLTVDTFQGQQRARRMVIDGEKGKLSNRQAKEPIEGLLTDAERAAEPIEFPDETATSSEAPGAVETEVDTLYAGEAGLKISMRKTTEELQGVEAKLSAISEEIKSLAEQAQGARG